MDQLKIWEEKIRRGGSTKDKYTTIDKWTHDRFVEARQSNQQVTTRNLQQWALAAASQFPDLEFKASETWVKIFKRKHRIRQRKITKFVSERETATMEETHAAAEKFRLHTRALIPNYDKDFVLYTDQTGCQYQSTYNRTLAEQGSKVVLVKRKDMNKVTHSYTAQYVMTLSGKLLPTVFICLQEANGNFGPGHAFVYRTICYDPIRKTTSNGFHLSARGKWKLWTEGAKISRRVCENIYKRCHYILKDNGGDPCCCRKVSSPYTSPHPELRQGFCPLHRPNRYSGFFFLSYQSKISCRQ
ncbi:HTH CENPB-type domain-containing protein [Trichonephila clavipes]|nr:HTH CENPB-type domain-containing protein [Trichonephila clavipes]